MCVRIGGAYSKHIVFGLELLNFLWVEGIQCRKRLRRNFHERLSGKIGVLGFVVGRES
jgi:hypothetical protein